MRLTIRDGITTSLAVVVIAITLAVTGGWDWPLVGTPRAGILALGAIGIAMCSIGTRSTDLGSGRDLVRRPGMLAGTVLGSLALVLVVVGLIVGTEEMLVALAAVLVLMWAIATVRHAVVPARAPSDAVTV
jgi:hypothetical protein